MRESLRFKDTLLTNQETGSFMGMLVDEGVFAKIGQIKIKYTAVNFESSSIRRTEFFHKNLYFFIFVERVDYGFLCLLKTSSEVI